MYYSVLLFLFLVLPVCLLTLLLLAEYLLPNSALDSYQVNDCFHDCYSYVLPLTGLHIMPLYFFYKSLLDTLVVRALSEQLHFRIYVASSGIQLCRQKRTCIFLKPSQDALHFKNLAVIKIQEKQMPDLSVARDFSHHFVDAPTPWQNGDMLPKLRLLFVDRGSWCFGIMPHITSLYLWCLWHISLGNFPKSLTDRKAALVVRDFPGNGFIKNIQTLKC